jgi:hypothetical protein
MEHSLHGFFDGDTIQSNRESRFWPHETDALSPPDFADDFLKVRPQFGVRLLGVFMQGLLGPFPDLEKLRSGILANGRVIGPEPADQYFNSSWRGVARGSRIGPSRRDHNPCGREEKYRRCGHPKDLPSPPGPNTKVGKDAIRASSADFELQWERTKISVETAEFIQ